MERLKLLAVLHCVENINDENIEAAMATIDKNGDHKVSFEVQDHKGGGSDRMLIHVAVDSCLSYNPSCIQFRP